MMIIALYRNKRNEHKQIELKRYGCGAYYWRQKMVFDNGVENYVGSASKRGRFSRISKKTADDVLMSDYEFVKFLKIKGGAKL